MEEDYLSAANLLYENLRIIANRTEHIRNDFLNEFIPKKDIHKKMLTAVDENLKTIVADTMLTLCFIGDCLQVETDEELEILIDAEADR